MRDFTATELARMQSAQEAAMQDACRIGQYQSTDDNYGNPTAEYVYGELAACGVEMRGPDEAQGSGDVPVSDATIRLALGTALDERDRIRVEQRYGVAPADPVVYEIEGPPKRGPSGLVVECAEVDDGT